MRLTLPTPETRGLSQSSVALPSPASRVRVLCDGSADFSPLFVIESFRPRHACRGPSGTFVRPSRPCQLPFRESDRTAAKKNLVDPEESAECKTLRKPDVRNGFHFIIDVVHRDELCLNCLCTHVCPNTNKRVDAVVQP